MRTSAAYVPLPLALVAALYFLGLGAAPFHTKAEPREALQVWEEVRRGEWILPYRNGTELPSKPPLFHWLAGAAALLNGAVSEAAVRFPSALSAALTVILIYWYAARRWGAVAGLCAAAVLATNFEWIRAARMARVDMVLTASLTAALVAFDAVAAGPRPPLRALLVFYLCVALAVLAKGPVGVVLPVLVVLAYLGLRRDLSRLRHMHLLIGTLIAIGLPALWYGLAFERGGTAFIEKQLFGENVLRFVGQESGPGHWHPFYYYASAFFAGFLPWSIFLPPLIAYLWAQRRSLAAIGCLYPLVWFTVVWVFYSVAAGKRSVYILPAYPAVSVLLGVWLQQLTTSGQRAPGDVRLAQICALLAALVAGVAAAALLIVGGMKSETFEWIGPYLHPRDRANLPLVLEVLGAHSLLVTMCAVAVGAAAVVLASSLRRQRWDVVVVSLALVSMAVATVTNLVFYPAMANQRSLRSFMPLVRATVGDGRLAFYDTFDYGAIFYFQNRIPRLHGRSLPQTASADYTHILIGERQWEALSAESRAHLTVVARSHGTGPKGNSPLLLARFESSP